MLDPEQIRRVMVNLLDNAVAAVDREKEDGSRSGPSATGSEGRREWKWPTMVVAFRPVIR